MSHPTIPRWSMGLRAILTIRIAIQVTIREWVSPSGQASCSGQASPIIGGGIATGAAAMSTSITTTTSIGITSITAGITSATGRTLAGVTSGSTTHSIVVIPLTLIGILQISLAAATDRALFRRIA